MLSIYSFMFWSKRPLEEEWVLVSTSGDTTNWHVQHIRLSDKKKMHQVPNGTNVVLNRSSSVAPTSQYSPVCLCFLFVGVGRDCVHLLQLLQFDLLYQSRTMGNDGSEAVGGLRTGKGHRSARRKPAALPLCPPWIRHGLKWARNRPTRAGSPEL
jgi:hypothetical protein